MGVGMDGQFNYTEKDVKERRAFTGWTVANGIPGQPYGRYASRFIYNPADHDNGEKTFLGHTGNFNGEDIIDIICQQPATADSSPVCQLFRRRRRAGTGLDGHTTPGPGDHQDAGRRVLPVRL